MSEAADRKPLIAGNWKLFKTADETTDYINKLKELLTSAVEVDVTLSPTFPALEAAVRAAAGTSIRIAAQNVFWEKEGAFTGEVSAGMLKAVGVDQVIIGHSERRQYFGETDETVNRRVTAALEGGLDPILCVGETLEEREGNRTLEVLETQVVKGLENVDEESALRLTIAYEPVWAIGTGKTATPGMAQEAHAFIRELFERNFNKKLANSLRILYGGSVKPENASALMAEVDLDGALVGGASLKPESFFGIINFKAN